MVTLGCENLQTYVERFSLISECDTIRNGAVRFSTPFTYPDGSFIDLFLTRYEGLFDRYSLSDYGQTYHYLYDMGFKVWSTKHRRQLLTDIISALDVKYLENTFLIPHIELDNLKDLPDYIVRLSQACIRIADLSFMHRSFPLHTFEAEIEEVIASTEVPYETDIELPGRFSDMPIKIDFRVQSKTVPSLVQTLSSKDAYAFHALSNEVFVKWDALRPHKQNYQFVTIFDETSPRNRPDDFGRLYELSTTFAFPSQRNQFIEAITV